MDPGRPRIGLLGAAFDTHNRGVSALTEGAILSVLASFPHARILLLDYGRCAVLHRLKPGNRPVLVPLINLRFSRRPWQKNHVARLILTAAAARLVPDRLRRRLIDANPTLKIVDRLDLCAAVSGGDSFGDLYGVKRFLYVALPQVLVLLMGKPLVLLPQTLGPFCSLPVRALARAVLRSARAVFTRDPEPASQTAAFLRRAGVQARFCYDLAFLLEPSSVERTSCIYPPMADRFGTLVGFNVSGLLYLGAYKRDNAFQIGLDYPDLVARILEFLLERPDTAVLLVPHVFGTGTNDESDAAVCEALYRKFRDRSDGRLFTVSGEVDHRQIKRLIGGCDLLVGSRMHACIAALSQGVPALGLAYSGKFAGVFASLGLESWVIDLQRTREEQVLEGLQEALRKGPEIRRRLETILPLVRSQVLGLFGAVNSGTAAAAVFEPNTAQDQKGAGHAR